MIDFEITSIEIGNQTRDAKEWTQPDGSIVEYIMRDETIQINVTYTQAGSSGQPAAAEGYLQIWHPVGFIDVDPYWNRDFGFGMVDAYAATLLAIHLKETGTTELVDPGIQNHLLSFNETDNVKLVGHSWSTSGSVESVNFRIDGGENGKI